MSGGHGEFTRYKMGVFIESLVLFVNFLKEREQEGIEDEAKNDDTEDDPKGNR